MTKPYEKNSLLNLIDNPKEELEETQETQMSGKRKAHESSRQSEEEHSGKKRQFGSQKPPNS